MAKKDPAFLFYPKDWLEGTAEMHPNEKGVYIDLLCYQHQKGDLPTDTAKLARLVRLSLSEFTEIWTSISSKFETIGERTYNKRLNEEVNERSIRAHKNKVVGWFSAYLRTHELNKAQYSLLKKTFKTDEFNNVPNERLNECINEWCNERLKSIEDANANANNIIIDYSNCTAEGLALIKYVQNLANVSNVKNQLTPEEANRLMVEFPKEKIKDILTAMENRANLVKNNLSVNLTIRKWIKNKFDNNSGKTVIPSGVTAN